MLKYERASNDRKKKDPDEAAHIKAAWSGSTVFANRNLMSEVG